MARCSIALVILPQEFGEENSGTLLWERWSMQAYQRDALKPDLAYKTIPPNPLLPSYTTPFPAPLNYSNTLCLQFSHLLVCLLPLARPSAFLNRCECGLGTWTASTFVLERLARARSTGGHGFSASTNSKEEDSSLKGHSKEFIDKEIDYVGDFAIKEGNLLLT